jgi:hypothetical protein
VFLEMGLYRSRIELLVMFEVVQHVEPYRSLFIVFIQRNLGTTDNGQMYSQASQYISYKTTIKKIILMTYCCKQILVLCLLESKQAHV